MVETVQETAGAAAEAMPQPLLAFAAGEFISGGLSDQPHALAKAVKRLNAA